MDPASAFSVAAGAFQLADLCCKGAKAGYEIYRDSEGLTNDKKSLEQNVDHIESAALSLKDGLDTLRSIPNSKLTPDQCRVQKTVEDLLKYSTDLRRLLSTIKLKSDRKKRELPAALRNNMTKGGEIKNLRTKLEDCRRRMDTGLMISQSKKIDFSDAAQREALAKLDESLLRQTQAFRLFNKNFERVFDEYAGLRSRIGQEGHETRRVIEESESRVTRNAQAQAIIDALSFPEMSSRESRIADSSGDTLKWIFAPFDSESMRWSDFGDWLANGSSFYWINGKPGAGKSTLMKFIANHDETTNYLLEWAADKALIMPKFFFWRAGSLLERSITGMLRSIVLQILKAAPEHTSMVAAGLWSSSMGPASSGNLRFPTDWQPKKLATTLQRLLEQVSTTHKICIFIDGLDEFEGDGPDTTILTDLVRAISKTKYTKLLVSSRPEPHLLLEYHDCPQLKLQDLSRNDIEEYIEQQLGRHARLQNFFRNEQLFKGQFIYDLCERSDGVFLWASLAMNEVARGISRLDSPAELKARLKSLESSLHGLFRKMVSNIDVVHRERVALLLKLVLDRLHPSSKNRYSSRRTRLNLVELAASLDWCDFPVAAYLGDKPGNQTLVAHEVAAFRPQMDELEILCLTQCAGLLEITSSSNIAILSSDAAHSGSSPDDPKLTTLGLHSGYYSGKHIGLIHRSAHEFLESDESAIRFLHDTKRDAHHDDMDEVNVSQRVKLAPTYANLALDAVIHNRQIGFVHQYLTAVELSIREIFGRRSLSERTERNRASYDQVQRLQPRLLDILERVNVASQSEGRSPRGYYQLPATDMVTYLAPEYGYHNLVAGFILDGTSAMAKSTRLQRALSSAMTGMARSSFRTFSPLGYEELQPYWLSAVPCCRTITSLLAWGADSAAKISNMTLPCSDFSLGACYLIDFSSEPSLWDLALTFLLCEDGGQPVKGSVAKRLAGVADLREMIMAFLSAGADVNHFINYSHIFLGRSWDVNMDTTWVLSCSSSVLYLLERIAALYGHDDLLAATLSDLHQDGVISESKIHAISCTTRERLDETGEILGFYDTIFPRYDVTEDESQLFIESWLACEDISRYHSIVFMTPMPQEPVELASKLAGIYPIVRGRAAANEEGHAEWVRRPKTVPDCSKINYAHCARKIPPAALQVTPSMADPTFLGGHWTIFNSIELPRSWGWLRPIGSASDNETSSELDEESCAESSED